MRVLASGLAFAEGPVWLDDGALLVAEPAAGRVTRIARDGSTSLVVHTGGGPNGLALGPDGALYVANNGGLSFSTDGGRWNPTGLAPGHDGGAIQRVDLATGEVETLFRDCDGRRLGAPNDLVFDGDGRCWFTDTLLGCVFLAEVATGDVRTALAGLNLPNGIGFSPDGARLYVSETYTGNLLCASTRDGDHDVLWSSRGVHGLDSLAVARGGDICVGGLGRASGILVIAASGVVRSVLEVPEHDDFVTNICFDRQETTAYITSGGLGRVYAAPWRP